MGKSMEERDVKLDPESKKESGSHQKDYRDTGKPTLYRALRASIRDFKSKIPRVMLDVIL